MADETVKIPSTLSPDHYSKALQRNQFIPNPFFLFLTGHKVKSQLIYKISPP